MTGQVVKLPLQISARLEFYTQMIEKQSIFIEENFVSSSGYHVPWYGDLRPLASDPKFVKSTVKNIAELVRGFDPDILVGLPMSGSIWSVALSLELDIPQIILRKEPHSHGRKTRVVGDFYPKNSRLLIIDDSFAGGNTIEQAVEGLRAEGYTKIVGAFSLFSAFGQAKGRGISEENSKHLGIPFYYTYSLWEYVEHLEIENQISPEYANVIRNWMNNPLSYQDQNSEPWNEYFKLKNQGKIWIYTR